MKPRLEIVTDHAVIRYLERVYGVDLQRLRRRIAKATQGARLAKAGSVKIDGVRYVFSPDGRVVTVHGVQDGVSKRGQRWKAKHK